MPASKMDLLARDAIIFGALSSTGLSIWQLSPFLILIVFSLFEVWSESRE